MIIKIHRGKNQIGGNIVEISTPKTRILLDIGLDLKEENNEELPKVEGLFDKKGFDAVFISHYHGDHIGLAYKINKDIPLYMGKASFEIVKAADKYIERETLKVKDYLVSGKSIVVGDITVTPFLCDHSAFDSYMLLCESEGESILYTGDFRSNGRKSFDRFISQLPKKVDTLICEGTTLSRKNYVSQTETDLENKAIDIMKTAVGPVFVLQSSTNIDRIVTMYRAAKQSSRIFLEELFMADITSAAGKSIPNPQFSDVYPFITTNRKFDGLSKYHKRVGKEFIKDARFVMCVRTSFLHYLEKLSEIMSFDGGVLIYSFWSGYKEKDEIKIFLESCEKMGLTVVTLHTSGHADAATIKRLIDRVNPKQIVPIHTENEAWFTENYPEKIQKS